MMKKRLLASLLAAAMTLTMAPAAFAAETAELSNNPTSSITTTKEDSNTLQYKINWDTEGKIVLDQDYTECVKIEKGEHTIDLNGHKITNKAVDNTITVAKGATLTIVGKGTVDNVSNAKAAIWNNGTCTINGGTYTRSKENGQNAENSGGNSYYNILNHGDMVINDGATVQQNGSFSSLLDNGYYNYKDDYKKNQSSPNPTLTINGGMFTGGINTIKNEDAAILTINGGTFTNYTQAAFQNHGTATVTGGEFTAESKYSIDNCGCDEKLDPGKLEISGGTFVGTLNTRSPYSDVTISGGNFKGDIQKNNGKLSISGGYFTSDPSAYCVVGKTGVASDIGGYKFMVGELKENKENNIKVVPDKGENAPSISTTIKEEDRQNAREVASNVDTVEAISDSKTISDKEKLNAVTALKNINAINVGTDGKIEGNAEVSIIKKTYLDVTVKDYVVTGDSNVYTISMDITPKYNLIATTDKNDATKTVTFSTGNKASVTARTEVTVTLPKEFAGKLVYINHNDKNLYTATADENGKITFVTDGFSPFTFTLTKPSIFNTSSSGSSGGSSSKTTYKVTTSSVANGGVNVSPSSSAKGDKVKITLSPDKGYKLDKLTVTDASGKTVSVTKTSDTVYTFTMPASQVTVGVTYVKAEETTEQPSTKTFSDVSSSDWFADAVKYVSDKGMMNGTGNGKFSPADSTTRAMLMTVIARYAGEDTTGSNPWYQKSMEWAKANGVSDGTAPNANITREQLVTMLYRYAKASGKDVSVGEDTNILSYTDATTVSEYAVPAMQWACGAGIVNGANGKLNPQNNATRAEVAAILMRFCENIK